MRGMWKHLERLGGGVGTRGPGESQLESDRRMARRRLALLRARLREVAARRGVMRRSGRSTKPDGLAGRLHQRRQVDAAERAHGRRGERQRPPVRDARPTTRAFREAARSYLVTDTVGFIRKLPHMLVEAFAATLEETLAGDLVLLVADASAGEEELAASWEVRACSTDRAEEIPQLLVLNKIDAPTRSPPAGCATASLMPC